MFILNIFKKYKIRNNKEKIIRSLINWLNISSKEKDLYLSTLEFLDDNSFSEFYNKITQLVERIEWTKIKQSLDYIKIQEKQDKVNNNFLFDNLV